MMILTDSDIDLVSAMPLALAAIDDAMMAMADGALVAPPRHRVAFPSQGNLFFTIGGDDRLAGFRVYDTFDGPSHTQITAVWATDTAELVGLVLGDRLGEIRTGAIGGLAVHRMSRAGATTVGIIGSGPQARSQLLAVAAVRPLTRVWQFSRSLANRESFCREMEALLGVPVEAATSAEAAVADADIVICATSSPRPVLDASWLKPGAHVSTVGPKTIAGHEVGTDVARRAAIIATDSLAQTRAYTDPFFLDDADAARMVELSAIVAGREPGRLSDADITLFCSVGLAGTEVFVAERLLQATRKIRLSRSTTELSVGDPPP
jgi:ornithine cyclodeaminase/alanine dehydrogenase-like protein (mu-crystallin family)